MQNAFGVRTMKKAAKYIALALVLLTLTACGREVALTEDELSGVFEKYPEELEFMEEQLGADISDIDEDTFHKMQEIATCNMSEPNLYLSGLITALSVMRFERGAE